MSRNAKDKKEAAPRKRAWFEVSKDVPGIHGNTGLPLIKGTRHFLDTAQVGGEEGNDLFRPVDGPHKKKEDPPPGKAEEKREVKDA